jgi:uncharacterized membrane protein
MHLSSYLIFCLFATLLAVIRMLYTGTTDLGGLVWNLILAFLPYVFALGYMTYRGWIRPFFFFFWLFFLPNSFYILTDFVHLPRYPEMVYYDIVYITAMAFAGMVSGYASMEIMHREWNIHLHKKIAWLYITLVMIISMIGVYMGRFLRFNTWDIWHNPLSLVSETWTLIVTNGAVWSIGDPDRAQVSQLFEIGAM